jgi:osmotically-inducible protein OsmY
MSRPTIESLEEEAAGKRSPRLPLWYTLAVQTMRRELMVSRFINHAARAVIALAAVCMLAACASGPPKTDAQKQADQALADRVQTALTSDKLFYGRLISVRADNGVVYLTGYVWDPPDLATARIIAEGIDGVSSVVNNLELQRNGIDDSPVAR